MRSVSEAGDSLKNPAIIGGVMKIKLITFLVFEIGGPFAESYLSEYQTWRQNNSDNLRAIQAEFEKDTGTKTDYDAFCWHFFIETAPGVNAINENICPMIDHIIEGPSGD